MNPPVIDPLRTVLVLIDLQRGITGMPTAPHSGPDVVKNASLLAEQFRKMGSPVALVRVAFSPDGKDALNPRPTRPTGWARCRLIGRKLCPKSARTTGIS